MLSNRCGRLGAALGVVAFAMAAVSAGVAPAGAQEEKQANDPTVNVKVFNDCYVKNDDGTVVSYFGYELKHPDSATLQAGSKANYMSGAAANSGQPSALTSGVHSFAFSVTWSSSGAEPVWHLDNKSASGTSSGSVCKEVPAVPEFPLALVGPVVAMTAFGAWFHLRRRSVWSATTAA